MKNIIKYLPLYFFLLSIFTGGCERVNDLYTADREIVKEVSLEDYNYVRIWSICDIRLVEDTVCKAVVKGKKSVVNHISFKQEDHKIFVREKGENKWHRGTERPLVEFHFTNLGYFRIEEPARLYSEDTIQSKNLKIIAANELSEVDLILDTESLYFENWTTNTGEYKFSGKCHRFHIKLYGSGRLQAEDLITSHAVIEQHSISNGYLSVEDTLEVYTSSEGDIYYLGHPQKIIFEQEASGKLIKIE
ncbi:MAG: GIN domain-containing protein [Bacteroidota bacterium]